MQPVSPETAMAETENSRIEVTDLMQKTKPEAAVNVSVPGSGQTTHGIESGSKPTGDKNGSGDDVFGIYVVKPGDNLWDIHFRFLKHFYETRHVRISNTADEPTKNGKSSGVGKILKFSENIVYIYNVREKKLDFDLNNIQPLSKILIYNMKQIFNLLESVDYKNVQKLQFDGDTLWIPAE